MPLVASFQVADGLAGSCGGVLRGLGRQHLGAAFNLLAYYVLALPLGITLAFRAGYGLQGLWIGASLLAYYSLRRRLSGGWVQVKCSRCSLWARASMRSCGWGRIGSMRS